MMSVTPTAAPCAASSSASPWPMPLPPPVTTATRPAISVIISSFYFWQHLVRETLELVIDQLIRQAAEAEICQHLIIAHHLFTDQMMLDQIFRRADHIAGDIIPVGLVRTAGLLGHGAHISVGGVGGQGLKMVAHEFIMIRHGCEHAAKIFVAIFGHFLFVVEAEHEVRDDEGWCRLAMELLEYLAIMLDLRDCVTPVTLGNA